MHIDWRREVNEATAVKIMCDECEQDCAVVVYADRRLLCHTCAESLGLSGHEVSYERILRNLLYEMRDRLDEWAGQLERFTALRLRAQTNLTTVPTAVEWGRIVQRYRRLEDNYLHIHRIFRRQGYRIPEPGWRSSYVERVVNCGFQSKLGD